jgi:uncharacterized protein (UPF0332 family)
MVSKELEGAKDDLETARKSLTAGDYKWATIQAYYSIFHAARHFSTTRTFENVVIEGYSPLSDFSIPAG